MLMGNDKLLFFISRRAQLLITGCSSARLSENQNTRSCCVALQIFLIIMMFRLRNSACGFVECDSVCVCVVAVRSSVGVQWPAITSTKAEISPSFRSKSASLSGLRKSNT